MTLKHLIVGVVLALGASSAQAASVQQSAEFKAAAGKAVEKAQYGRCWWRNGYRVCDWYEPRVYDWYYDDPVYGWGSTPRRPEDYPAGSKRWWEEMEREDRG